MSRTPAPSSRQALLTPLTEVCQLLGLSRNTAYRLISHEEFPLPLVRIGRRWYVRTVDIRSFLLDGPPSP